MPTLKGPITLKKGEGKLGSVHVTLPFKAEGWTSEYNSELVVGVVKASPKTVPKPRETPTVVTTNVQPSIKRRKVK